jgi:predicted  nucleic acid-binding Zn-ribbon protein
MDERLGVLIELQELDSGILERRSVRDRFPEQLKALEQRKAANRAELDRVREALETAQKAKRDRDSDLEAGNQKVEKLKARTSEIKTNKEYQAHLKEIETAEQETKAVEEDILKLMESIDAATTQIATAETRVRDEEAAIEAEQKQIETELAKVEGELKVREQERHAVAVRVDSTMLNRYQGLFVNKGGKVVVEAKNELCAGCRMKIPPQLFVNIKKGVEILECPHCHRILYFKQAIEAK